MYTAPAYRHKCKHSTKNVYHMCSNRDDASTSTSTSTRKRNISLLLRLVLASLQYVVRVNWDNTSTSTREMEGFFSAELDKQLNVFSSTLTVTQDGNGN